MEILSKIKRTFLLILLTSPLFVNAGGGWPKSKGAAYYKVSQWWVVAARHYASNGGIDSNVTTGTFNTSFYGEYGITDRVTGIVYFPFFSRTFQNAQVSETTGMITSQGESVNSIGDADISVKYGITRPQSKFAFAGTLLLGLPLGKIDGGSDNSLQTGDGEFNQMIRFDLSRSFSIGKVNAYGNIYAGFNNRTQDFSDEFRTGGEAGFSFLKNKLWIILRMDAIESLQNGLSSAEGSNGTSLFSNNTEFVSYIYEVAYYATEKFGVSASYSGAFSARLIFAAPSYSVGVFLDLK